MKTLKLFNAVVSDQITTKNELILNDDLGLLIVPGAKPYSKEIRDHYTKKSLNGNDFNKTFHKSWQKIKESSRCELLIEQIRHYISTYGSDFKDEVYIPNEVLNIPDLNISYKVIKSYTKEEMISKSLGLLQSGIALKEDTINDVLSVLTDELKYKFTGDEGVKNKEAVIKIADLYGIYPKSTMEFFRYLVYRATGQSLLIKSPEVIDAVKSCNFNPAVQMEQFGLKRLSKIFNRYKPLFLAFKNKCPKTINKISKLSKKYHSPMVENPLNNVTVKKLKPGDRDWLDNATVFSLFKALSACYSRMNGQDSFVYRIRNGKSWVKQGANKKLCKYNYEALIEYIQARFDLSGKKIFIPKEVKYSLPTSEKMFIGNIPTGTKFVGKKLAAGIYWKNSWGARDLDLSGINIGGKVGWNSQYNQNNGSLMYSGDMTNASAGAVEYLHANRGLKEPTLVQNNVYSGENDCGYKIVIGKGDKVSREYMMNPNNVLAEVRCDSVQKQTILGMFLPKKDRQSFVLLNFGSGNARVSGNSEVSNMATKALYQQWRKPLSLKKIIKLLGGEIVKEKDKSNIDLSLNSLEKDTIMNIFTEDN